MAIEPITCEEYRQAVVRLVTLAGGDTGGSRVAAQVVLSAYNGHEWQLSIPDLCNLDSSNYQAALNVIRGRTELLTEPQKLITDGEDHFRRLWKQWERYHLSNQWAVARFTRRMMRMARNRWLAAGGVMVKDFLNSWPTFQYALWGFLGEYFEYQHQTGSV